MTRIALIAAMAAFGCAQTTHEAIPASIGQPADWAVLEAHLNEPGPINMQKVVAASWEVELSGMLNLDHPNAEAAGLENDSEPIEIYFYALNHPTRGTFLVDTGVARSIAQGSDDMPIGWLVQSVMNTDALEVHVDTKTWLDANAVAPKGVLLTHLHLDHILGLTDMPRSTPIYVGPGEADDRRFLHLFGRSTTDENLQGLGPLNELQVARGAGAPFAAVDVLGDGSLYGLHVPGHTRGSMAYLVRTTDGPQLLTGDGCHTAWGWHHDVEPGTFNTDSEESARSLAALRSFAKAHPEITVHLGHQPLTGMEAGVRSVAQR
jgi:glyoxylase-like metal-dependent hydrolase (beta-lactamase superfamily II)